MPATDDDPDPQFEDDELDELEDEEDDLDDDDLENLNGEDFDLEDDDEEEDEMKTADQGAALPPDRKPARSRGGVRGDDDMAADRVGPDDDEESGVHAHQDELLDEGVEETFPASDPVSVKRIT